MPYPQRPPRPARRAWDFWRRSVAAEVEEELAFHLTARAAEYEARGLARADAESAARERFGDVATVRHQLVTHDAARERRQTRREHMDHLAHDVRLALRGFRRTPTFVVAVLAILGLGIGMATAMAATLQAVLVRHLPVVAQDRVVVLWPYQVPGAEQAPPVTDLQALRRASRTMRGIAGVAHFGTWSSPFVDGDRTLVLAGTPVTGNYFEVLGARPTLGRLLRSDDEAAGAPHVMVLSDGVWRTQFGGDPHVVGRRLVDPYSRGVYTVVGVAPPGLDYPVGVGVWTPIVAGATPRVFAVARLADGARVAAARAEFFATIARLEPAMHLTGAGARTFADAVLGDATPMLGAIGAAVALLLLIACVNVGTLVLVRTAARAREFAVRRALGARSADLLRQLVVESALLAAAGGALGMACAAALLRVLVRLAPAQLPRLDDVRLHGSLTMAAVGVTALAVVLFGLLPSLAGARGRLPSPLRADVRAGTGSRRGQHVRQGLVASQVALAVVLLAGAGLLARSLRRLEGLELGYRAEHLSLVDIAPDWTRYDTPEKANALGDRLERQIGALPGVRGVTTLLTRPFDGAAINLGVFEPEAPEDPATAGRPAGPSIPWEAAGADYFRTLDVPVSHGRGFRESDEVGTPLVAVVSASVARRMWPGRDPVGQRLRLAPSQFPTAAGLPPGTLDWRTVVGVVPDMRPRTLRELTPMIYVPWRQAGWPGGLLAVRSIGDARPLGAAIRRIAREIDPTLAVWRVRSMDEELGRPLAEPRLTTLLLSAFGAVALTLATVGLYGVVASTVREQTREIGVRVALGATPARVRGAVLRRALVVVGVGAVVGLAGAFAATRALRALLFEVSPADPIALLGACAVLVAVAVGAALVPAHAATRIDPARTLRAD